MNSKLNSIFQIFEKNMMICFKFFKLTIDKLSSPLNLPYRNLLQEKNLNYPLWKYKEYNWKRQEKISIFFFNNKFIAENFSTLFGNWSLLMFLHRWSKLFLYICWNEVWNSCGNFFVILKNDAKIWSKLLKLFPIICHCCFSINITGPFVLLTSRKWANGLI